MTYNPEIEDSLTIEDILERPRPFTDHSKSNPGLHMLYVKSAVRTLLDIDSALAEFYGRANGNYLDTIIAVQKARADLIKYDQAFVDAQDFVKLFGTHLEEKLVIGALREERALAEREAMTPDD